MRDTTVGAGARVKITRIGYRAWDCWIITHALLKHPVRRVVVQPDEPMQQVRKVRNAGMYVLDPHEQCARLRQSCSNRRFWNGQAYLDYALTDSER